MGDVGRRGAQGMNIADRMGRLGTESAFEVLAKAKALERQGREVVHLEIGEPDFDTPVHIRDAAKRALDAGATHYGPSAGLPELREAIAAHISKTRGIRVAPEEVVVTPGAKPIMFFTIMALVNRGDEVIYPNPGFPIYESVINFVGGVPVPIPLREESGFGFDLPLFEKRVSDRTRLIVINSPQNPTGGVLEPSQIERIADIARSRRIPLLTDEIYREFLYEGEFMSPVGLPGMKEHSIILDGFSKSFAMTGWRLGYGVMPVQLAEHVTRLMVNSASCTASFVQLAGIAALQGDQEPVRKMVAEFRRRRDLVVEGLNKLPGVSCARPRGAFYVFPNVSRLGRKSAEVADRLLYDAGVATLSGTAFGEYGEGYLRLSYANSEDNLRKALARMEPVLAQLAS
jgi:aspartate/methionine/tyrosine aminotransferase